MYSYCIALRQMSAGNNIRILNSFVLAPMGYWLILTEISRCHAKNYFKCFIVLRCYDFFFIILLVILGTMMVI